MYGLSLPFDRYKLQLCKNLTKITKKHYPNQTIEKNEIGHGNQRNVIATVFLGSTSYFFLTKNLQIF